MKKLLTAFILCSVIIVGCKNGCGKKQSTQPGDDDSTALNWGELPDSLRLKEQAEAERLQKLSKDSVLTSLTKTVLTIFKNAEYTKLDSLIHPDEGIRFSPYATISDDDKQFSKEAFHKLVTTDKNKKINWGTYDGSGDPIYLTPVEYFSKFVYDGNFVNPEKYDINNFVKTGNALNNLKSMYRDCDFTESYISGSKKYGGMDWKSVRLVFKQKDGKYYLVGIVHDQWTI
jgi:hypothetical protein